MSKVSNIIKKILRESDFDWMDDVEETPNFDGHPQGVVYLYTHEEIDRFIEMLEEYNDGWPGPPLYGGYKDFHRALDEAVRYGDGITVSFFIKKRNPGKLVSGYWGSLIDRETVYDWFYDDDELVDTMNWEFYTRLSHVESIFNTISK